ncbi:unnamed protein product [Arabidopsis thaliana]|uniref:Uncharacterized protein n=1 Tax=Arabidopsis thaliana TaxID=3702 RepID=A0A5S9XWF2_ARATH|nr:unnamed protein product [Arabidopsis thaliana]
MEKYRWHKLILWLTTAQGFIVSCNRVGGEEGCGARLLLLWSFYMYNLKSFYYVS